MNKKENRKVTSKQIVAWIGIIALVAMYVVTLIVAIINPGEGGRLFQACLVATIAVPLLVWIYVWMYGKLTNKETFADANYFKEDSDNINKED